MKKIIISALIALLIPVLRVNADSDGYIVKFKDCYSPSQSDYKFELISASRNLYRVDDFEQLGSIEKYIEYYEPNSVVELIEGIKPISLYSIANDELYPEQWQLQMINAESAWNIETYGNDIRIAVIDSGCSIHDDLKNNVLEGKNYFDGGTDVTDDIGHGTHVSGIIAAEMNDIGIVGAAPKAKIVPLKCFRESKNPTIGMLIRAIDDAVDVYDCKVINMSWGTSQNSLALEEAINKAYEKGTILIASVGNDGNDTLFYSAAYENVLGIGSVTQSKTKSTFSQYNGSVFAVVSGQDVKSTYNDGDYRTMSGTSQAAPFVSGVAALALSADESLTPDKFKRLMIESSEDLGDSGYDTKFGYGLVNAEGLIDKLLSDHQYYVSPINIRDGKAFVYIKNNSADAIDAVSIFAEYDGTKYEGITTKKLTLSNNQETLAEANYSGNTLTHLLWDSLNGLKPLANMRKKAATE